ncbi:MAG: autotransporter outer membrane beta-barrel domain-containing protein [Cellvibrionaceae bacterium]
MMFNQKTLFIPIKTLTLPLSLLITANASALSLDEAVNAQLTTAGSQACAELLNGFSAAENAGRLTGGLEGICATIIPAGTNPAANSAGGGAAAPISAPAAMQELADVSHGKEKSTSDNIINTSINANWNLFFTAEVETLDRDQTDFEHGYNSDRKRFLGGLTYTANPKSVYSLAIDYNEQEGDFIDNDGEFERDSLGLRLLASYRPTQNTFFSVLAGYDDVSAEHERTTGFSFILNNTPIDTPVSGTPEADYDYNQYGLSVLGGYDYQKGNYTITPSIGLNWSKSDYGTYSETGNSGLELTFYDDEEKSLQSVIALTTSASFSRSYGTINPQFGIAWHHEFEDDQRSAEVSFTGDTFNERFEYQTEAPDRDFFNLSAGVVFALKSGIQTFINIQGLAGHEFYDNYIVSLGVRKEL